MKATPSYSSFRVLIIVHHASVCTLLVAFDFEGKPPPTQKSGSKASASTGGGLVVRVQGNARTLPQELHDVVPHVQKAQEALLEGV